MSYSIVLPTCTVARKGAQPTDLPVEPLTKFEVVINVKAAQALGLTIPAALRQEAEIVEAS